MVACVVRRTPVRRRAHVVPTRPCRLRLGLRGRSESLVGRKIHKYEIVRVIGRGGMGTVYEALNTTIGKRVAMKFVDAETAQNKDAVARFQREAAGRERGRERAHRRDLRLRRHRRRPAVHRDGAAPRRGPRPPHQALRPARAGRGACTSPRRSSAACTARTRPGSSTAISSPLDYAQSIGTDTAVASTAY